MEENNLAREHHVMRRKINPPMARYSLSCSASATSRPYTNTLTRFILALILAICITSATNAAVSEVLIIKSGPAAVYDRITHAAKQRIDRICKKKNTKCHKPALTIATVRNNTKLRSIALNKKWDLIVAVGIKAAKQLNSYKVQTPILYSLIPSQSFPGIRNKSSSRQKSAIYIDQPITRQLQLIKSAMPGRKKVGVLLGKYSGIGKSRLQQKIRKMGLKPVVLHVTKNNIGNSLEDIYSRVDVLLALPDPSVYNRKTIMKVLLSSYRHRVPVIGYSAAYVKSGAAIGIFSTPNNIGQQIGDEIAKFFTQGNRRLSSPSYPRYFNVKTNNSVINSLKLRIPSRKTIISRIRKAQ